MRNIIPPGFDPDKKSLRKVEIIDFIRVNFPQAFIPSKSKLEELRQISKSLIGSCKDAKAEVIESDSESSSPSQSDMLTKSNTNRNSKSNVDATTSVGSNKRGHLPRSSKSRIPEINTNSVYPIPKKYQSITTPYLSLKKRKDTSSLSPERGRSPTTPSKIRKKETFASPSTKQGRSPTNPSNSKPVQSPTTPSKVRKREIFTSPSRKRGRSPIISYQRREATASPSPKLTHSSKMQSKASQLQEPLRRKSKEGKAKKYSKTVNSISKPHRNKSNNKSNKFHTLEQDLVSDSETEPESSSNSSVLSNQSSTPIESVSGSSSSLSSAFSQSDNSENDGSMIDISNSVHKSGRTPKSQHRERKKKEKISKKHGNRRVTFSRTYKPNRPAKKSCLKGYDSGYAHAYISDLNPTSVSTRPNHYVEKQKIGDPLDIEERASPSPSFSRKNLGLPISSSDSSLELHTRPARENSKSPRSHRKKRHYPCLSNFGRSDSRDCNSFFTPASLSFHSNNPYQPANPPQMFSSPKTFAEINDQADRQPATIHTSSNQFKYSPVAFYNPTMPNSDNPYTSPNSVNCAPRPPPQKGDCSGTSWNFYPQGQYAMAATQPPSTATQPAKGQYPNYSPSISYAYTPYTNYSQYNHNQQSQANQGSSCAFQQSSVHQQQTTQGSGHCYQPSNFPPPCQSFPATGYGHQGSQQEGQASQPSNFPAYHQQNPSQGSGHYYQPSNIPPPCLPFPATGHGHQGTQQEGQASQPSNFPAPHQQKPTQGYPRSQPSSLPPPSKSFSAVGNGPQGSQQEGQALQPSNFPAHHQHQATQEYPHSQQSNPPPPSKYFSATGHGPQGSQQEGQAFQPSKSNQDLPNRGSDHHSQPLSFPPPSKSFSIVVNGHQGFQQEGQVLQPSNFPAPHQQKPTHGYPHSQPSSLPPPSKSITAVGRGPQGTQQEGQALQPSNFPAPHQQKPTHSQPSSLPPPSNSFSATGHGHQGFQQAGRSFQPSSFPVPHQHQSSQESDPAPFSAKRHRPQESQPEGQASQPFNFPPLHRQQPTQGFDHYSQPSSFLSPSQPFSATGNDHWGSQQKGQASQHSNFPAPYQHQSTQESECYFQTSTFPPPGHSNPATIYEQQSSEQEGRAAHPSHFHVPHQYQTTKELVQHPRPSNSLLHSQPTSAGFSTSSNPKLVSINQLELPVRGLPQHSKVQRETIPHTQVTSPTPPPPEKACSSAQNTRFLQVSSAKTIPAKTSGFEFSFQSAQSIGDLQPVNPSQGTLPPNFSKSSHSQNSKSLTNSLVEPSNDKCSGRTGSFFKPIPQISNNSSSENRQEFTLTNLQKDCDQTADSSKITSGANNIVDNINQNPYPASQCSTKNESVSLPSKVTLSTVQNMEDSLSLKAQDNISKDSLSSPPPKTKSQITTALINELNEIEKASLVDASKK
ncbi:hypothetical protein BY996DRAFT_6428843 [Phakopsora pachyrhizi]|nr:hypothetical protein BY996DRAFT_6428843 [Phakopsora pachyrhizi]